MSNRHVAPTMPKFIKASDIILKVVANIFWTNLFQ